MFGFKFVDFPTQRMAVTQVLLSLTFLLAFSQTASSQDQFIKSLSPEALFQNAVHVNTPADWTWQFRPHGFIYGTYWASAAEPRLATHLVRIQNEGSFVDSHIGGRFGLVRFGPKDNPEGFQLDIVGGAKLRQDTGELDVFATDYRYDILGTYGSGRHRYKFGFYHVSSHLGDEFLLKNPGFDRLNYFRDAIVLGYSYNPTAQLRLYGETSYAFRRDISGPWEFQFGFDYGPAYSTGVKGAPFIAMNGHLRQEVDFGGNFAMQAGWAWRGDDWNDGILRTGLYYYNGKSPQFSFFNEREQQVGWGVWFDF